MLITRPTVGPSATAFARSPLPPAVALSRMAAYPLPAMFTGWTIFPAVTRVEGQDGSWDRIGGTRLLYLADGGTVTETLIEWAPGSSFAYELTSFTDLFGRIVKGVRGEWSVAPDGDGSLLRWTWEFAPLPFRRGLMAHVIGPMWRVYSQRILVAAVADASRDVPAA